MAARVFGGALDMERMRFRRGKWYVLQPRWITMAPDGNIWLHPKGGLWRDDYSAEALWLRGLIVHELTHVWQRQQGVNLVLRRHPFCRYSYRMKPGRPFHFYGIEQQAEIVRHAFLQSEGQPVPAAPPLDELQALLPFSAFA